MTVFKPGDLVVLKSGGPEMTVDTVNTDIFDDDKVTGVLCAWFVGHRLERARFDCNAIAPSQSQQASCEENRPPPPEATGEYRVVLDEMVAAMNDSVEASEGAPRAPTGKPNRASTVKDTLDATAPVPRR
jgi:uncharacterized protein YodC (DUF2158 family)